MQEVRILIRNKSVCDAILSISTAKHIRIQPIHLHPLFHNSPRIHVRIELNSNLKLHVDTVPIAQEQNNCDFGHHVRYWQYCLESVVHAFDQPHELICAEYPS